MFCTLLSIFSLFISFILLSKSSFNYMGCKGMQPWEVDYNQSVLINDTMKIQTWLYARQHSQWRCDTYGIENFVAGFGIGNSYLRAVISMTKAIEGGRIYRPGNGYFWASNTENCTYGIQSLDCYFHGLSSCKLTNIDHHPTNLHSSSHNSNNDNKEDTMNLDDRQTELGMMLRNSNTDICQISKLLKKSMAWVVGQYLNYIIRPRHDILLQIHNRGSEVFKGIDRKHQSIIAVHYRVGKPDFNRKVLSLDDYMRVVRIKAKELAMDGKPVGLIYLASQDNLNTFYNESYMINTYGGNYSYKFLLPIATDSRINVSEEIELELKRHPEVLKQPYVIEFLTDYQLMVKSDCFIGSISTIYMIVMLARYAKHPTHNKGYTCLLDNNGESICEDDNHRKYDIYSKYYYWMLGNGDGGEDRFGGFRGGTPF